MFELFYWWHAHTRVIKNITVLFVADIVLLICGIMGLPLLGELWNVISGSIPNFYEQFILDFMAFLLGNPPGSVASAGNTVALVTIFLTLITIHWVIALGIGKITTRAGPSIIWSIVNYFVLIGVVFGLHLFLIYRTFG